MKSRLEISYFCFVIPFPNHLYYPNIIPKKSIHDFSLGVWGEATKLSYRRLSKLKGFGRLAIRFWDIVDTISELAKAEKGRFEAFRSPVSDMVSVLTR